LTICGSASIADGVSYTGPKNSQSAPARAVVWIQFSAMEHKPGIDSKGTKLLFANATPQPIPYEGGPLRMEENRILDAAGRLRAMIECPPDGIVRFYQREELPSDTAAWQALRKAELLENLDGPLARGRPGHHARVGREL
jgi:hypothetical protein